MERGARSSRSGEIGCFKNSIIVSGSILCNILYSIVK